MSLEISVEMKMMRAKRWRGTPSSVDAVRALEKHLKIEAQGYYSSIILIAREAGISVSTIKRVKYVRKYDRALYNHIRVVNSSVAEAELATRQKVGPCYPNAVKVVKTEVVKAPPSAYELLVKEQAKQLKDMKDSLAAKIKEKRSEYAAIAHELHVLNKQMDEMNSN